MSDVTWHSTGVLKEVRAYRDGELQWAIRWDSQGRRPDPDPWRSERTIVREWHPNGRKALEVDYLDDTKHGVEIAFDLSGKPTRLAIYVHGDRIQEFTWTRSGRLHTQ
ncbi:MAG: toxin-antitoxin system YwqK family antitoxin [Fidelibacterota bacterium]